MTTKTNIADLVWRLNVWLSNWTGLLLLLVIVLLLLKK